MLRPVERLIAIRYLRARSEEGFVSTITYLSFLGILLGVAALIVVSAVMSGARARLVNQILDLNGHITIEGAMGASVAVNDPHIASVAQHAWYSVTRPDALPRGPFESTEFTFVAPAYHFATRSEGVWIGRWPALCGRHSPAEVERRDLESHRTSLSVWRFVCR